MKNTNLIIGKINSYKTTGVLFNEVAKIIDNNENLIILDKKEEYFKTFKDKLEKKGYKSLVFNVDDAYKSDGFNPLRLPYKYYKEGNIDKCVELIRGLSEEIFKDESLNSDPFWSLSAINYFTSLVLILFKEGKDDEINLYSIQSFLSTTVKNDGKYIQHYFDNLDPMDVIYKAGSGTVYAPSETKKSIISVMNQHLNIFFVKEQLLNNLAFDDIDLRKLPDKVAIFVMCDDLLQNIGNILIDQVASLNIKMNYILDNFDGVYLRCLKKLLNQKAMVYVAIRNKKQFEDLYGEYIESGFENIMDNISIDKHIPIGNCNDYPKAKFRDIKYFDAAKFLSEEYKNKGEANFMDFVNKEIKSIDDVRTE